MAHTDTGTILLIRSLDHGRTWDPASKVVVFQQETDLGWNIAAITALTDGRLVACANCWLHLDNGRIDETPEGIATAGNFMHIGYPTSVQLDDGSILTAYHLFSRDGRQLIEGAIYQISSERLSSA